MFLWLLWVVAVSTLIGVFIFYCIIFIQVCLRYLDYSEVCGLSACFFVEGGGRVKKDTKMGVEGKELQKDAGGGT